MKRLLIPCVLLGLSVLNRADSPPDPAWWSTGNQPVIDSNLTPTTDNRAPANIGQAMFMAHQALEALRAQLPTVAYQVETDLVGVDKPIKTFDVPAQPDAAWHEKQKAPLLVGQLKAFYKRLNDAAPQWLQTEREANKTQFGGSIVPWPTPSEVNNHAMATIGQLKAVFALHFELDSDSDSMVDLQEWFVMGSLRGSPLSPALLAYLISCSGAQGGIPYGEDLTPLTSSSTPIYHTQTFSVWSPRD